MEIKYRTLDLLLAEASISNQYQQILKDASKKLSLTQLKLDLISPEGIRDILQKRSGEVQTTSSPSSEIENGFHWGHFQYKAFVWLLIIYAALNNRDIDNLNHEDLGFFEILFAAKPPHFLLFNALSIAKSHLSTKAKWTQQQNELLTLIMKESQGKYHWSQVSYLFFVKSGCRILKPRQKCREQWVNHLDPEVKKDKWSRDQDLLLFRNLMTIGKKWSKIAKLFQGTRNEHMVKNRYNSLIHKHKAKCNKMSVSAIEKKILRQLEKRCKRVAEKQKKQLRQQDQQAREIQSQQIQEQQQELEDFRFFEGNDEDDNKRGMLADDRGLILEPIPGWDFSIDFHELSNSDQHRLPFPQDFFLHLI